MLTPDITTDEKLYWSFGVNGTQTTGDLNCYLTKDAANDVTSMEFVSVGDQRFVLRSVSAISSAGIYSARVTSNDGENDIILDDLVVGSTGVSTLTAAQVNTECDTALADYDPPTKTELDSGFAGLNNLAAADVTTAAETAIVNKLPAGETEVAAAGITAKNLDDVGGGGGGSSAEEIWAYSNRTLTESAGGGANNFYITIRKDDAQGIFLSDINIQIMDEAESQTIVQFPTGTDGRINVDLDNGTYHVFLRNSSYKTPGSGNPVTLIVSGAVNKELYMVAFDPGQPPLPGLCRVMCYQYSGSGQPEEGKIWTAKAESIPAAVGDGLASYIEVISTKSDVDGYNYADLIQGLSYKFRVYGKDYKEITIPAQDTALLKDLLSN